MNPTSKTSSTHLRSSASRTCAPVTHRPSSSTAPLGRSQRPVGRASRGGAVDLLEGPVSLGLATVGFKSIQGQGRDRLVDQVLDRGQRFTLIGANEHVGE